MVCSKYWGIASEHKCGVSSKGLISKALITKCPHLYINYFPIFWKKTIARRFYLRGGAFNATNTTFLSTPLLYLFFPYLLQYAQI
jgi:hypothetical protein